MSNEYTIICIIKCCVNLVKNIIVGFLFWKTGLIIEIGERVVPEAGDKGDQGYPGNLFFHKYSLHFGMTCGGF